MGAPYKEEGGEHEQVHWRRSGSCYTRPVRHLQSCLKVYGSFVLLQQAVQETIRSETNRTLKKNNNKPTFCKSTPVIFRFMRHFGGGGAARPSAVVDAALPVILSWVQVRAEQRPGLLGRPLAKPARSWMAPNLSVHLNLPAEQTRGDMETNSGPTDPRLRRLLLRALLFALLT